MLEQDKNRPFQEYITLFNRGMQFKEFWKNEEGNSNHLEFFKRLLVKFVELKAPSILEYKSLIYSINEYNRRHDEGLGAHAAWSTIPTCNFDEFRQKINRAYPKN